MQIYKLFPNFFHFPIFFINLATVKVSDTLRGIQTEYNLKHCHGHVSHASTIFNGKRRAFPRTTQKMKKIFTKASKSIMMLAFLMLALTFSMTSCSGDDEPEASTGNIVGTWVNTETTTDASNVTYTKTRVFSFQSNGTGYRSLETSASTGASEKSNYTFHYTVAVQTNGVMTITTIDDDDSYTQTWSATQTGKTLIIDNVVFTKK